MLAQWSMTDGCPPYIRQCAHLTPSLPAGGGVADRLRPLHGRRLLQRPLGEAGRLRLLRALHGQHHRVPVRGHHVRKRRLHHDVRVGQQDPRLHDVPARLLQHLPAGQERLEDLHQPPHGRQEDQLPAGDARGPAEGHRGRVRHLLPGVRHLSPHHALPPLLPRAVPEEVALHPGHVPNVPSESIRGGGEPRQSRLF